MNLEKAAAIADSGKRIKDENSVPPPKPLPQCQQGGGAINCTWQIVWDEHFEDKRTSSCTQAQHQSDNKHSNISIVS